MEILEEAGVPVVIHIPYAYAHQLEALDRLDLGDEWMRAVMWENGARLLGLSR